MPLAAVLDASGLYRLPLRDTLLRVAETELYNAYWVSESSTRSSATSSPTVAPAISRHRLTDAMSRTFDVLAAAVASDAQAVVT